MTIYNITVGPILGRARPETRSTVGPRLRIDRPDMFTIGRAIEKSCDFGANVTQEEATYRTVSYDCSRRHYNVGRQSHTALL